MLTGKELIDFIGDYLRDIRQQRVYPNVSPGYMRKLLPDSAPIESDTWDDIMLDVKNIILPGVTHWQSPYMHAYFPALNSYPSLLGDMIADAINCLGFTWASSPACTELETIVMDWLGKMIDLPSDFLHSNTDTSGGGVIQTTASESTFVSILAARTEAIRKVQEVFPDKEDSEVNGRLIAYCSDQAHSSIEKAGLIGLVRMRYLASDDDLSLRGQTLANAIVEDRKAGYIPFYLCATLGTTGACAFDNLAELGPICNEEEIYLHIDAAYAGSAFVCPEFRGWLKGVIYAQSFSFNPSKWLMVHFDCTAMWIKDSTLLHRTFNVDPLYLQHENSGEAIDYMHWQIGLSRRFRALKLWCVLRSFGVSGIQKHIRRGVELAKLMESLVISNPNFQIPAKRHLGMIVFRLKGENELTETLLKSLNYSGQIHMVPASLKGTYIIRFTVTSQYTTEEDIRRDWNIIAIAAREVVLKLGGLWIEEIEDEVEVDISEDESGIGDDINKDASMDKTSLETIESEAQDKGQYSSSPSSSFSAQKDIIITKPFDKKLSYIKDDSLETVMDLGKRAKKKKMIPRKQMSVIFDPRASAKRRATAASYLLEENETFDGKKEKLNRININDRRGSNFGVSLLLSNTPHSPQFINGSYAAIFENPKVVNDIASHLRRLQSEYSPWRQGPPPTKVSLITNSVEEMNICGNDNETNKVYENKSEYEETKKVEGDILYKRISIKPDSSGIFKKAIANLFDEDKRQDSSLTTKQKRFKNRQLSLDSRLNFYSRAINDISAAADAVKMEQNESKKFQMKQEKLFLNKTPEESEEVETDNMVEMENDKVNLSSSILALDRKDIMKGQKMASEIVPFDTRSSLIKSDSISNIGRDSNASIRRRRRIIDIPFIVPPISSGGVKNFRKDRNLVTQESLYIDDDSLTGRNEVGIQVEENMLPFEDQPYSSHFITSPFFMGKLDELQISDQIENPNDKTSEANISWVKIKQNVIPYDNMEDDKISDNTIGDCISKTIEDNNIVHAMTNNLLNKENEAYGNQNMNNNNNARLCDLNKTNNRISINSKSMSMHVYDTQDDAPYISKDMFLLGKSIQISDVKGNALQSNYETSFKKSKKLTSRPIILQNIFSKLMGFISLDSIFKQNIIKSDAEISPKNDSHSKNKIKHTINCANKPFLNTYLNKNSENQLVYIRNYDDKVLEPLPCTSFYSNKSNTCKYISNTCNIKCISCGQKNRYKLRFYFGKINKNFKASALSI
ncbi:unnamed protein product [Gordionus sp. m RMFG-2023]